jgi:hypothetical protein
MVRLTKRRRQFLQDLEDEFNRGALELCTDVLTRAKARLAHLRHVNAPEQLIQNERNRVECWEDKVLWALYWEAGR